MGEIGIRTDGKAALKYYRDLIASLRSASGETKFSVANTDKDEVTGEYIYPFVNDGRGEIVAKNSPKKVLRIPIGPNNVIFRKSAGPSHPLRIDDRARPKLEQMMNAVLLLEVVKAANDGGFITGRGLSEAAKLARREAIEIFRQATIDSVRSRNFERDVRLSDSFVIVEDN